MIPKGNQRGGGRQLATHLLNEFDNGQVEVADLRGSVAQDLHGAFHEWFAQSKATKCQKYLYSLSVNPDLARYGLTREQYLDFAERTERSLKLVGQPRAVVFHTKNGRQHCHVVWSRIDQDAGKAVHMDHDRFKLQAVTREFARAHGLPLPPGMGKNGKASKEENLAEKQQQERSGITKEERIAAITAAWQEHRKNPRAFVKALEEKGYQLARGDSGRYIVVDHAGEIHALARQIEGVRSKEIKDFLGPAWSPGKLPDIETARAAARQAPKEQTPGKEERAEDDAKARRDDLARHQAERRAQLDLRRGEMEKRFEAERRALTGLQTTAKDGAREDRADRRGILAFLARITGIQAYIAARQDAAREKAHRGEHSALDRRHGRERHELERRAASLTAVEARERQSLEIALKRRQFQKAREIIAGGRILPPLKPEFTRAADPRQTVQQTGEGGASPKGRLSALFTRMSQPFTRGDLQKAYEKAKDPARKPDEQERTQETDPEKLEQARERKDDLERRLRGHDKDRDRER